MDKVTAAVLVVGNEILSGRTRDANIQFLGAALGEMGITLAEARVVPDVEEVIVAAVNELRARHDYLFTTGGIGPTHDDITTDAVGKAVGKAVLLDPRAVDLLKSYYANPADLNEARLRMARIPEGAELVANPVSRAPGYCIENVFVLAGIPRVMQAMFDDIRPRLKRGARMLAHTVTIYKPEGVLAGPLAEIQQAHPSVDIGSYPFVREDRLGAAIVIRAIDAQAIGAAALAVRKMGEAMGAEMDEDLSL